MPRNATEDSYGKRTYTWRDQAFPSVTTILGCLNKPWLVGWAKKFTAEYAVKNIAVVNAMLQPNEEGTVDAQAAVDYLKGAAYRERDRAADLGSAVHLAFESYALGKPMPMWPLPVQERMRGFEDFLAAYEPDFTIGMAEVEVFSRRHAYAGTLDGVIAIDGRPLVIDYKTGKFVGSEVALQLCAYRHADFVGAPDGTERPMPEVEGGVCLHLPPSGDWRLIDVQTDETVWNAFLYIREAYDWYERTNKGALRGDYQRPLSAIEAEVLQAKEGAA